jgi:hypothetical protein
MMACLLASVPPLPSLGTSPGATSVTCAVHVCARVCVTHVHAFVWC